MSPYVLDTDTMTLWLRGQPRVCKRILAHEPTELCTTIVTIEEILSGWYTQIRRARNDEQMARAYAALQQTVEIGSRIPILAFDLAAIQRFNELRKQQRRVGTNDLKIAAMVMGNGAVLVTRNQSDFAKIPACNSKIGSKRIIGGAGSTASFSCNAIIGPHHRRY